MMKRTTKLIGIILAIAVAVTAVYMKGIYDASGGIVAVVPGRFAIAVYSPPLDSRGNSVRGVKVVEELSGLWNLHIFAPQRAESR